jgi:hypothetical protein
VIPLVGAATTIVGTVTTIVRAATSVDRTATPLVGRLNETCNRPEHLIKRKQKERLLKHQLVQNGTMATTTM